MMKRKMSILDTGAFQGLLQTNFNDQNRRREKSVYHGSKTKNFLPTVSEVVNPLVVLPALKSEPVQV